MSTNLAIYHQTDNAHLVWKDRTRSVSGSEPAHEYVFFFLFFFLEEETLHVGQSCQ